MKRIHFHFISLWEFQQSLAFYAQESRKFTGATLSKNVSIISTTNSKMYKAGHLDVTELTLMPMQAALVIIGHAMAMCG